MRMRFMLFGCVAVFFSSLLTSGPAAQRRPEPVNLPDGHGKEVVQASCTQCHALNLIADSWGYTRDGWRHAIESMTTMPKDRLDAAVDYLAKHYPPRPAPEAVVHSSSAEAEEQVVGGGIHKPEQNSA